MLALGSKKGRDREYFSRGKFIGNFKLADELITRFKEEFEGLTCEQLQVRFTGRTYNMWDQNEYAQFEQARGDQCAVATATVTRCVVEMLK